METVSAIVITLNEEKNIERCLRSVRWMDEIIVVDSFSHDRTVELARNYTDKVYQHEYPGSSKQYETAIGYAKSDWVFIIDADEEMSGELASEVNKVLLAPQGHAGYEILRKPFALGRWIEHGGWFPDYQLHFFRKDSFFPVHREVHGGFRIRGTTGRLDGLVYHYTYPTISSYVSRMNDYTSLQVSTRLDENPSARAGWHNLFLNPASAFLRMFMSRRGYRDGLHGFVLAALEAMNTTTQYAKLWEYRMRQAEGNGLLPPLTNAELNRLKRRQ